MGLSIKKGDTVLVISGNNRPRGGQQVKGRILAINPKKGTALVEGVNMMRKSMKARSQQQPGGIIEQEAPIRLCKLMLVDPKGGKAGRFANEVDANGNKIRRSKRSGNEI